MTTFEEYLSAQDGTMLYSRAWLPDDFKGILAFSHGLGEHIGRYENFAAQLNAAGYGLYMADLHGHGKTPGKRGHFSFWEESLLSDLKKMIMRAHELAAGRKVFFGGHSFGGLNAARLLVENPDNVSGGIIMSPAIRQTFDPPKILIRLVNGLAGILPGLRIPNFLDYDGLSRDTEVVRAYQADPLVHKLISTKAFQEMVKTQGYTLAHASEVKTPCLIIHGLADRLTDAEATRAFFEEIPPGDKTLRLYEGFYHETHNDLGNEMVYSDIVSWLNAH